MKFRFVREPRTSGGSYFSTEYQHETLGLWLFFPGTLDSDEVKAREHYKRVVAANVPPEGKAILEESAA